MRRVRGFGGFFEPCIVCMPDESPPVVITTQVIDKPVTTNPIPKKTLHLNPVKANNAHNKLRGHHG